MLAKLLQKFSQQNKQNKIIYPDVDDKRVYDAVKILIELGDNPVICGTKTELERYQQMIEEGLEYILVGESENNLVIAAQAVKAGEAYGFLGGNISTTTDILRALIKNIGSKQNISRTSSHFIMGKGSEMMLYSDAGVQIDPNAEQLAEIAYLTILSALRYGMTPRVAMLSFSTAGSGGDHDRALKVREATLILRQRLDDENMDIPVEGEIQFDAAFVPEIGKRKNPNTQLTKPANVFIFPDLDSANIAYKITQRLAGYQAFGPILQGFASPANDLSRGCSVDDIIAMHHITKNS